MGHGAVVSPRVEQHDVAQQIEKAHEDRSEKMHEVLQQETAKLQASSAKGSGNGTAPKIPPLQTQGNNVKEALNDDPKSPKAGGLAARRKLGAQGISILTKKEGPIEKGEKVGGKNEIKLVERFTEFYKLQGEVMPSTNTGMEVLFAKRIRDGVEMVVKTRVKKSSFTGKSEENEWRRSTEMLLNLPESENIARVYEVMEDRDTYYIVMEKVGGMDLFELLQSEGRMPIGQAKAILRELLKAVNDLHMRGCIHKDLKLENIMVDPTSPLGKSPGSPKGKKASFSNATCEEPASPTVKLIDFDTVETYCPKSKSKSVVGTDQYIAQEAYAGHYSFASDIFSVGVIAYRLISGRFPFKNAMFDDKPGENWVGSPKMKQIQDRLKHFHIDFDNAPWPQEPKARDLTRWMLQTNEKDRPTAEQTLSHAFLEITGKTPALPKGTLAVWGK